MTAREPILRAAGALAVAVAALAPSSCGSAPRRAGPPRPAPRPVAATSIGVSPQPGTPDASPGTQVSFLGAPAAALGEVTVDGPASGRHGGRLAQYASEPGASFLPDHAFVAGEQVHVRVRPRAGGLAASIDFRFTIARPAKLGRPPRRGGGGASPGSTPRQTFHSRRTLHPPSVKVTTSRRGAAAGDVFVAPLTTLGAGGSHVPQRGPMILDSHGVLVWFLPMKREMAAENLAVQRYRGAPALTWWQGQITPLGFGQGEEVIADDAYRVLARVRGGNGYRPDFHDFVLSPRGTAWFTTYAPVKADLRSVGGPRDGAVVDSAVQEVDIATGLVMFEWHSLGHIGLGDSHSRLTKADYDYSHINSIQVRGDRVLLSARNTWTVYEISRRTGRIVWRLGGRHSTFALGRGVRFAWQHDAQLHAGAVVSVFDNEAAPVVRPVSRALLVRLDRGRRRATLLHEYRHPAALIAGTQGSAELLPNRNTFVGWGSDPYFSEFTPAGQLVFDGHFTRPIQSYRAYRFRWTGHPASRPSLAVRRGAPGRPGGAGAVTVYASWNGATEVATWQVLAGPGPNSLKPAASARRAGFETAISLHTTEPYIAVRARDRSGRGLGTSAALRR